MRKETGEDSLNSQPALTERAAKKRGENCVSGGRICGPRAGWRRRLHPKYRERTSGGTADESRGVLG